MVDLDVLTSGDLRIVNGDLAVVTGVDQIRQRIEHRLRVRIGEWFTDTTLGLDYFGEIFIKNPDLGLIRSRILRLLASTPEVARVASLNLTLVDRDLAFDFIVVADLGRDSAEIQAQAGFDLDAGELNLILEPLGAIV